MLIAWYLHWPILWSSSLNARREVTIAGAGLVGSLLAVLLSKRGHQVRIFEKRADMRLQSMSAGRSINLALAERGIHALRQAEIMDEIEPLLIPMRGRQLHELDGSNEFMAYGQRPHEVIYSVSRGELNKRLMNAAERAGTKIWFERDCQSVDFEAKTFAWKCADGLVTDDEPFDLIIGADGAGSEIRDAVIAANGGQSESQMLDHSYKELCIPAADDGTHRIERNALHIWPRGGFMLIALPNIDGSFTVTLFLPRAGKNGFESLTNQEAVIRFFNTQFPDAQQHLSDLVADFFGNPTGLLGTLRCFPWSYKDRGLILGDASHAIVPFHGQGMNAGFEDCSVLIELLDRHQNNWSAVLQEFQNHRKPDAEAIADMALENYIIMRDSVSDPAFQLKKELGFELERRRPNRFIPRYSLVMFHRVRYSVAFERGQIQDQILSTAIRNCQSINQINVDAAEQAVIDQLPELSTDDGLVSLP